MRTLNFLIYVTKKRKKKKTWNLLKTSEAIRRKEEIKTYGKLVSLRPGRIMRSKRQYDRKKKVNYEDL